MDDIEDQDTDDQIHDDHDDDADADGGGGGDDASATGGEPRPPRKERQKQRKEGVAQRAREAANREWESKFFELQEQNAQLLRRLEESGRKTSETLDRMSKPQEKPFRERVRERLTEAAKQIRDDDPESVRRYMDVQAEIVDEAAGARAREIVGEELKKFQESQPKAPSAEDMAYYAMAPWLREPRYGHAVKLEIQRLRDVGKRNLRDSRVWDATVREAITRVGKDWGLPVHGAAREDDDAGRRSVSGAGSRTFGGGGEELPELTPFARSMMDQHPTIKELPPEKREAAMRRLLAKNLPRAS